MNRCVYCGRDGNTTDHVVPRSRGGSDEPVNRVPCCPFCNTSKNNRLPSEWLGEGMSKEVAILETAAIAAHDHIEGMRMRRGKKKGNGERYTVQIRVDPNDLKAFRDAAESAHIDFSVWVRMTLRAAAGLWTAPTIPKEVA